MLELMALPTEAGSVEEAREAGRLASMAGSLAAEVAVVAAAAAKVEVGRPPAAPEAAAVSELAVLAAFFVFSFQYLQRAAVGVA
jgi:hypothetical protein